MIHTRRSFTKHICFHPLLPTIYRFLCALFLFHLVIITRLSLTNYLSRHLNFPHCTLFLARLFIICGGQWSLSQLSHMLSHHFSVRHILHCFLAPAFVKFVWFAHHLFFIHLYAWVWIQMGSTTLVFPCSSLASPWVPFFISALIMVLATFTSLYLTMCF